MRHRRLGSGLLVVLLLGVASPASAQGPGLFVRSDCTTITAPVTGQSWCFDATAQTIKVWTGVWTALGVALSNPVTAAQGGTGVNSGALSGIPRVNSGTWVMDSSLTYDGTSFTVASAGPHSIGGLPDALAQWKWQGTWSPPGATEGRVLGIETTVNVPAGQTGEGIHVGPLLVKAGSGTHPTLMGLHVQPTFGAGAATVNDVIGLQINSLTAPAGTTNASMIKLSAPTGAPNVYAIWADSGTIRFDGTLLGVGGNPAFSAVDIRGNNTNLNFSLDGTTANQFSVIYWRNSTPAVTADIWATGDASTSGILRIKGVGSIDLVPNSVGIDATGAAFRVGSNSGIGVGTSTLTNLQAGQMAFGATAFGSLPAAPDGTILYCSDCDPPTTVVNVCASVGTKTGAMAVRINGAWNCLG